MAGAKSKNQLTWIYNGMYAWDKLTNRRVDMYIRPIWYIWNSLNQLPIVIKAEDNCLAKRDGDSGSSSDEFWTAPEIK